MNILCVGDIVGKPGRHALKGLLEELKTEHSLDFVIVNAENAAGGAGVTTKIAKPFIVNPDLDVHPDVIAALSHC